MSTTIEQGATPGTTETVTVTTPQGTPQTGVTPPVTPDTAARIAQLERDLASANTHISTLNNESKTHRLAKEKAESALTAKDAEIAELLKHGTPQEILTAIQERDTLKGEKTEAETRAARAKTLDEVAKALDLPEDGKAALQALDRANLVYEIKEEKKGNVTEKVVYVDGKPFDEAFKPFLPALRPAVAPRPGAGPAPVPALQQQQPQIKSRPRIL